MKRKNWSIILFITAFFTYFFPSWNGFLFESSQGITPGDGRIQASIFLVGGLLLWYQEKGK
jgi:hypothetical protein